MCPDLGNGCQKTHRRARWYFPGSWSTMERSPEPPFTSFPKSVCARAAGVEEERPWRHKINGFLRRGAATHSSSHDPPVTPSALADAARAQLGCIIHCQRCHGEPGLRAEAPSGVVFVAAASRGAAGLGENCTAGDKEEQVAGMRGKDRTPFLEVVSRSRSVTNTIPSLQKDSGLSQCFG